tara:strand:+ start:198 stop:428 length:231 start_codon:yes stop_codon:yes gene_type:complete
MIIIIQITLEIDKFDILNIGKILYQNNIILKIFIKKNDLSLAKYDLKVFQFSIAQPLLYVLKLARIPIPPIAHKLI